MKLTYLGHSAFEIETNNSKLLIDPFLVCCKNYIPKNIDYIFITHGHSDHLGSSIEISKSNKCKIVTIFELANYCSSKGANADGIGIGAWINFDFGKVIFLPAFHSSSSPEGFYTGSPASILFEIDGKRIYHAGDTSLNNEMKLINELYKPDIALLPIGGTYTMGVEEAIIAAKWIDAKTIIPMHYNTFPQISVNVEQFKQGILDISKEPKILSPEEYYFI